MEPNSVQTLRPMRSIHSQPAARVTITSLSRMSASASGNIGRPAMAKLAICASGKARPVASASTTGRPVALATSSGWKALPPPISAAITARNGRPV